MLKEARLRYTQPWRPRFSSAGDCKRKLVYEAMEAKHGQWPTQEDRPLRWNAAAVCGTAIGEVLEEAAERASQGEAISQVAAMLPGSDVSTAADVTGTADVVWPDAVWDFKCVGGYAFKMAKQGPDPKHVIQVQGYASALGKPNWALIYIDLGSIGRGQDLPVLIHEGTTDVNAGKLVLRVWQDVERHVNEETLPDRDFEETKCTNIKCRFLDQCWKGALDA